MNIEKARAKVNEAFFFCSWYQLVPSPRDIYEGDIELKLAS